MVNKLEEHGLAAKNVVIKIKIWILKASCFSLYLLYGQINAKVCPIYKGLAIFA